jgi:hypothetical protein
MGYLVIEFDTKYVFANRGYPKSNKELNYARGLFIQMDKHTS